MKKRVDIAVRATNPIASSAQMEGLTRGAELSLCKPTRGFLQVCCGVIDDHLVVPCTDQLATRRQRQRRRGQRFDMGLLVSKWTAIRYGSTCQQVWPTPDLSQRGLN